LAPRSTPGASTPKAAEKSAAFVVLGLRLCQKCTTSLHPTDGRTAPGERADGAVEDRAGTGEQGRADDYFRHQEGTAGCRVPRIFPRISHDRLPETAPPAAASTAGHKRVKGRLFGRLVPPTRPEAGLKAGRGAGFDE